MFLLFFSNGKKNLKCKNDSWLILSLPQYVLVKETERKSKLSHNLNPFFQRIKYNYNTKMGLQNEKSYQSKRVTSAQVVNSESFFITIVYHL